MTLLKYQSREVNTIREDIPRKDYTYDLLSDNFYYKPKKQKLQLLFLAKILETRKHDPSALSKASYIYGLNYKWDQALKNMERVIVLEKWKNIDSWIDYGLFLRKNPKYHDISIQLLLDVEWIINTYNDETEIREFLETISEYKHDKIS